MGLQIKRQSSYKLRIVTTVIAVAALVAQPVYGFVSYQVAHALTANVTQVAFTTGERTIEAGNVSSVITVQAQNSTGAPEKYDTSGNTVTFTSDSATGEFSTNGSTKWAPANTTTHGSGSMNTNVYYEDSAIGVHTITVTLDTSDGRAFSAQQSIDVTAQPNVNHPPVASDSSVTTNEDTPYNGALKATDADGDILTYKRVTGTSHGTLSLKADGSYTYTPATGFTGTDSFTYLVSDSQADSNTATVTITVSSTAPSIVNISNVADLRTAIENQKDGQIWNIAAGTYALGAFDDITAGGQTGWYFPITANNITIIGDGNPTIYGTGFTANGDWSTQDFMAIFGNNVTVDGLTLMPKVEPNKTIEVIGGSTTIKNVAIKPNTLTNPSEYNGITNAQDRSDEQHWGGSIYYNNATGVQTLENVTIENGGLSDHSPSATLNMTNVKLNYSTNVDWINGYRYATHGNPVTGSPKVTYQVSKSLNNLADVLTNLQNGDTISLDSNLSLANQLTLTKSVTFEGNHHTLNATFAKTDNNNNAALAIEADNVVVSNLVEDGTGSSNLHGVNVYNAKNVQLNDLVLKNNPRNGLVVNGSTVTVNNLTTSNNGWGGVDVDKSGAVLTVDGTSHQTETAPDIYVDNTNVGQLIDTNHQYASLDNVKQPGDRVYDLALAAPLLSTPANGGYETTNNFYFTWGAVPGASTYEYQSDSNANFSNPWDSIKNGNSEQNHLTSPQIHSTGAPDGVYYWRVRALDALGVPGAWSPAQSMTIDTQAPSAPTGLSWKTADGTVISSGGITNVGSGTAVWNPSSSTDVDHYVYKYWNDIPGNQYKEATPYVVDNLTSTNLPGSFNQGDGVQHFCVEAVDHAGNVSACTEFTITYDSTAPVATITSPTSQFIRGTVTISGTVSDANPGHYYLVVKNSKGQVVYGPGTVNQANVSNVSWNTAAKNSNGSAMFPDGNYTIDLEARDAAGNKGAGSTATYQVTVDNTAPQAPTITSVDGADIKGTEIFTITMSDSSDKLSANSSAGKLVANSNGTYSLDTTGMAKGTQVTITATETDEAGNSTVASETYTVENTAPTVSGITMGHDTNGQYWLSGSSANSANSMVSVLNNGKLFAGPTAVNADGSWTVLLGALPKSTGYNFTIVIANTLGYSSSVPETFTTAALQTAVVQPSVTQNLLRSFAAVATPVNTATNPAPTVKGSSNKGVLGAQTTKSNKNVNDTSVLSPSSQGWKILGFAWYWWLILIAAIAALWYWLAATRRRHAEEAAYLNK